MKNQLKTIVMTGITLLFATACTNKNIQNEATSIHIDISEASPLKEAVTGMDVYTLQDSTVKHFPGDVSKLIWRGDSIFILDRWKDPGIYLYKDGLLVNSYTKKGNGPEEFVHLADFNVTPSEIILLDTYSTSQQIVLDRNFSFQSKKETEIQANHFYIEENNSDKVWYDRGNVAYGTDKAKLVYVNSGNRKAVLPVPEAIENITFTSSNVFARLSDDTLLYLPVVEPVIYKCYDGQAEMFCQLDFGDLWPDFSTETKRDNPLELMQQIHRDGKIYSTNLLSDGNDVAFSFFCKDSLYILMLRYNEPTAKRLLKVDKSTLESLGALVDVQEGSLVFGKPGNLLKLKL